MDPKLALKPRIVLQKIHSPLTIKEEVDVDAIQNDVKDILKDIVHCHYCTKTFSSVSAQHRHERRHKSRRCFQCTECEKSYTRAEHLRRHTLSHTGVKPFKCDSCEKRFAIRSQLVQHQRTHSNERPYKCTDCEMAFRQIGHLKQHSHKHTFHQRSTGYKRKLKTPLKTPIFACTICDKVLTTKRSLKSHVRIVHTGEKPYKCKDCDKTFASSQKYFYHKQSCHEDARHECPDCGRRFAALWMMKKHNLLHENQSDYVCPVCGKRFRQALYLKQHVPRHGGVQTCHVCGKLLPNPMRLRWHVKGHMLPQGKRLNMPRKVFDCGECGKQFTGRKLVVEHFTSVHANIVKLNSAVKTETEADLWEWKQPVH